MKKSIFIGLFSFLAINIVFAQQTELLTNPNFTNGTNGWWAYGADITSSNGEVYYNITDAKANPWDIQLGQEGISLKQGYKYTFYWRAKRDSGNLDIALGTSGAPYTIFITDNPNGFDGNWQSNTIVYIHTDTNINNLVLTVNMGGSTANVSFDSISLKEESMQNSTDLVQNSGFDNGTNGWWIAGATATVSNGKAYIDIQNGGINVWDVQMGQGGFTLKKGYKYTLSWRAKRDSGSQDFSVGLSDSPYTKYITDSPNGFNGTWQENSVEYIHTDADISGIGIGVQMGGNNANVTLDYLSLIEEEINDNQNDTINNFIGQSFSHPGKLELKDVHQFVCLSFDDNAYPDGVEWLCKEVEDLKNPNGNEAGLSFYYNSDFLQHNNEAIEIVNKYLTGASTPHEIGNHTYNHPHLDEGRTIEEWKAIIQKGMDTLAHYTNITLNELKQSGFRAPYVETNDEMFTALNELRIRYDHSSGSYKNEKKELGWPYMFKTNSTQENINPFWKVPVSSLFIPESADVLSKYNIDLDIESQVGDTMIGSGDYHVFDVYKLNASSILGLLKYNLDLFLQSNKAPFTFCLHSHYYSAERAPVVDESSNTTLTERQSIITEFIAYCQQKEKVYLTSVARMLDWMETPVAPEVALVNPGVGPVSYYGEMQVSGARIIGERTQYPMQVKGMSFFWSIWGGEAYWNAEALNALVNEWQVEIVRAPMSVEADDEWSDAKGYLNPEGKEAQIGYVETLVDAAIDKGIYVIIDFHSHEAHLHTEKAKEFFAYMAEKYGHYDNVIFEIYNEPEGPSYEARTTWAEVKTYAEAVIPEIRKHTDNLIVVAPPWYATKIEEVLLDPLDDQNTCYTLHFYAASNKAEQRASYKSAIDQGLPIFATEWGTVNYEGKGEVDYESSNDWMEFMDTYKISSANWSIFDGGDGSSVFKPGISRTGEGWADTSNLSPSGLYVYNMLLDHAQTAPWRKARAIDPEILHTYPGSGPVSYYGEMQVKGNRIYGERTKTQVQAKGMSLYWSIWGGEKYWNSGTINSLVDNWDVELIRAAMSVEGQSGWDFGYLHPNGKKNQIALMEQVVEAAIARDIYVLIDYHSHHAHLNTDVAIEFFGYMAEKYGKYDNVIFEIYNEPIEPEWPEIKSYAEKVIAEIRKYSDNLVVVGTPFYSLEVHEASTDPIEDSNTAYVFHFYAGDKDKLDEQRGNTRLALDNGIPLFASEWGNIYAYGDMETRTDDKAFESSDMWHQLLDSNSISSACWSILDTDMSSEAPNEAAIFNSQFGTISTTGENWGDTTLLTPSGLYTYKLLKEQAENALWRKAENQGYSINYHLDGGYNGTNPVFYPFNLSYEIVFDSATKQGFLFDGWYSSPNFTGEAISSVLSGSTSDIDLYAKWTKPDSIELMAYPNFRYATHGWSHWSEKDSVSFNNDKITIHELTDSSGLLWTYNFSNDNKLTLKKDKKYTLTWRAKRESGDILFEAVQDNPYRQFIADQATFNGNWQENTFVYEHTSETVHEVNFDVLLGGNTSDVTFDYISLKESDIIAVPQYTISLGAVPTDGGGVSGAGIYEDGKTVTLTATPNDGFEFINWTKGGVEQSTDAGFTITVSENATYIANFKAVTMPELVKVTFQVDMQNETVANAGVFLKGSFNNWNSNEALQNNGTVYYKTLELKTDTAILYKFVNGDSWENLQEGTSTSTGTYVNRLLVVPTKDTTLKAVCFNSCDACKLENPQFTISALAEPTEGGVVSGAGTFNERENITLIATADTGYKFTNWTKNEIEVSTNSDYSFTVSEDVALTAHFSPLVNIHNCYNNNQIQVFPNPSDQFVNLNGLPVNENLQIYITNYAGQFLLEQNSKFRSSLQFDLSHMNPGIYFIHINGSEINKTLKIVCESNK
ncbi:cellulase family glycosylhydrolase [Bacteroidales bacterium]|nr:cellulase family glycosylhydrolase [Bacteroidales bacterium]